MARNTAVRPVPRTDNYRDVEAWYREVASKVYDTIVGQAQTADIEDDAITVDKLNVTTLSAITANMGTLTAGTILQGYTAPGNNNSTPGAGLKIYNGAIEAYGANHAFGGPLASSDGNYMICIGKSLTATGKTKRYPLHNSTNFTTDGRVMAYSWSGSAWVEIAAIFQTAWRSAVIAATSSEGTLSPIYGEFTDSAGSAGGAAINAQHLGTGSNKGYGLYVRGETAPIRIQASGSASAPTHQAALGSLWVASDGILYINTSGSTTWQKVGAQ